MIGYRIAEEELAGENRAEYGAKIIKKLSKELTQKYGKGFTKTNLYNFYRFYKYFPEIFHTACGKLDVCLSWSHYRTLLQVHDERARKWYEKEAYEQTWSVRTLQRNIDTQYYYRLLHSKDKEAVEHEMQEKTYGYQQDKLEFIKNPVVVEFLGLTPDTSFNETKLETSIISNLQKFLSDDNPTLGIVLCSETDEDIARYSILHGNEKLFASKYKLYLPTEDELREEIETQKAVFYLQQQEAEDETGGEINA